MKAVLVAGTYGWNGTSDPTNATDCWWWPGSAFTQMLLANGVTLAGGAGRPFVWSTSLDGIPGDVRHLDWRAGGVGLYGDVVPVLCPDRRVAPDETLVITHSHGLQVALHAFAEGLQGSLISVAGPVRDDMMDVARAAKPNLRKWIQIHGDAHDGWQILGVDWVGWAVRCLQGKNGEIVRDHPLADENVALAGIDHTTLLEDPTQFDRWPAWLTRVSASAVASL